jgi:hypothetical protein
MSKADQIVEREALLDQLRPIEEILESARREVAQHRAACQAAEATGKVDSAQLRQAEAAADGVDELIDRFNFMADRIEGRSQVVDQSLEQMNQLLAGLRAQMEAVLQRLADLG